MNENNDIGKFITQALDSEFVNRFRYKAYCRENNFALYHYEKTSTS